MKFLLISDTHGKLDIINDLAERTHADAVIHAGDFGFYDGGSHHRLSDRELRLHVMHSSLRREVKDRLLTMSSDERRGTVPSSCPLSDFPSYMDGQRSFEVPVYAVWGNHEDIHVVERLFRGELQVKNLHLLHHRRAFRAGPAFLFGLGGNVPAGSKLMQRPIAGGAGKIWSTLSQYSDLVETVEKEAEDSAPRIFVSHVSPGKDPFIELVAVRTRADFTVSGHMGAPTCMVWNPFAVHTVQEAERRIRGGIEAVTQACSNAGSPDGPADQHLSIIGRIPEETVHIGRGAKAPRWYRGMTHINLPDAHLGYAVLDVCESGTRLQTFLR